MHLVPDGQVGPDVRARAPGRGAWIGVGRQAFDDANAKGKLKGALSRAFKTSELQIAADLGERVEAALRQAGARPARPGGTRRNAGQWLRGSSRPPDRARSSY